LPPNVAAVSSFEVVGTYLHRAGFNAVVVVIYRPGSSGATHAFFDDFSELLERLAIFSSPLMIVGDFNITYTSTTLPMVTLVSCSTFLHTTA
jgi:exonuclease III